MTSIRDDACLLVSSIILNPCPPMVPIPSTRGNLPPHICPDPKRDPKLDFDMEPIPIWLLMSLLLQPVGSCPYQNIEASFEHYSDVIMSAMASQITSLMIVYSAVYSEADQRRHQSSTSLAFVWGIHRSPVNSLHKGPLMRKMFPFDDVIMDIDPL